ncbi:hypothetical protein MLD38_012895 [Melastoma candidum]|uniref:Uncharacterized protein n=1 Tax=Melastoma candidum TaxID=119954 RepID=A0ACB9R7U2_9MYRT|nr:hypothetical protein MLD38_012895 [Melastoma candidum]
MEEDREYPNFHLPHDHHRHHHVLTEAHHGLPRKPLGSVGGHGSFYNNYWSHHHDSSDSSGSVSGGVGREVMHKLTSEFSFPRFAESLTSTTFGIAELHLGPSNPEDNSCGDDRILGEKLVSRTAFVEGREDCYGGHGSSSMTSRGDYSCIFGPVYSTADLFKDQESAGVLLDCYEESAPAAFDFLGDRNSPRPNDEVGEITSDDNTLGFLLRPSTERHSVLLEIAAPSFPDKKPFLDCKRPNCSSDATINDREVVPQKKKKVEATPPLKVRKEKLGDRISALQQLVAPFGKTDTASVLLEAIGYINFLQNQVQTLCVPYMKSSRDRNVGGPPLHAGLRPRGLCLVPLPCMSLVAGDGEGDGGLLGRGGGGFWPPVPPYYCSS